MTSGSANKTRVKALFPIFDQNKLIAHLEDFNWDFQTFGLVHLIVCRESMRFKYTASGNQEGVPFVVLQPVSDDSAIVAKAHALFSLFGDDCWIVRPNRSEDAS